MPINASQQEIGRLRELVRNKSKSPAVRIKHSKTLWSLYPSANNRRIIQTGLKRLLPLAEEADRRQALELLTQMETFKPKAKPSCLERSQAEPAARPAEGYWDQGASPTDRLFESLFGETQPIENDETKPVLPRWDGFTTLEPRFRGRTFPKDVIDDARERISVLIRELGIDENGTASLETYRALEDRLWERRSKCNLSMPSDNPEFTAITNDIAQLWIAWLSHCRPADNPRFGVEILTPLPLAITESENEDEDEYETTNSNDEEII